MDTAEIAWDESGHPRSSRFDDVYFSRAGGYAESEYVFLRHNGLPERFAGLARPYTIAETGFGTGLNFLLAWRAYAQAETGDGASLHYLSAEAFPLSRAELARALAAWPELEAEARELLANYPPAVPGAHRLALAGGRVRLTLLYGDAGEQFAGLYAGEAGLVDAWFLDGFAPATNPEMWSPRLFAELARLSRPGASFATFTAAGFVRRGLAEAGFVVRKVAGFGRKRDMLCGEFRRDGAPRRRPSLPWFRWPTAVPAERRAVVVGAGLAGSSTALALAERGWAVTVLERRDGPGREASGNRAGALYPHLHSRYTPATRIFLAGYLHSLRLWRRLVAAGHDIPGAAAGLAMLAHDASRAAQQRAVLAGLGLPAEVLRELADRELPWPAPYGGLYFPEGAWLQPAALCEAQLAHPGIVVCYGQEAMSWRPGGDGRWRVEDGRGGLLAEAPVLVLATGSAAYGQAWSAELPLGRVRGQVSHVPASALSARIDQVLCYEGYLTPAQDGEHCLGASYERGVDGYETSAAEHTENRDKLARVLPELAGSLPAARDGRVGYRLSCRDHLPIAGPMPDFAAFRAAYAELRRGYAPGHYPPPRYQPGLWLNIAHGSRGLATAPLASELLAAQLSGEALPLGASLAEALCPARFLIRELMKPANGA